VAHHEHREPRPVGRRWPSNPAIRWLLKDLGPVGNIGGEGGAVGEQPLLVEAQRRAARVLGGAREQCGVVMARTIQPPELSRAQAAGPGRTSGRTATD
jgi:hypothetical protein